MLRNASVILGQSSHSSTIHPRIADIPAVSSLIMPGPEAKLEHSTRYHVSRCMLEPSHDRVLSPLLNRVTGVPHYSRALGCPGGHELRSGMMGDMAADRG